MQDSSRSECKPLPDPEVCRTRSSVLRNVFHCLVTDPQRCPHVTAFGDAFFCWHPDRAKFEKPPLDENR
jgi:hypothetical protein